MPPITFRCHQCHAALSTSKGSPGDVVTCPRCRRMITVPGAAATPPIPHETPGMRAAKYALAILVAAVFLAGGFALCVWLAAGAMKTDEDARGAATTVIFLALFAVSALIAVLLFSVPILVAWARRHRNAAAITALTLLVGWTFLGWVAALVWALTDDTRRYRD